MCGAGGPRAGIRLGQELLMGRYYRRGHWVNTPSSRGGTKTSGWLIAGLVALALLFVTGQHGGSGGAEPDPAPSGPASHAPAKP